MESLISRHWVSASLAALAAAAVLLATAPGCGQQAPARTEAVKPTTDAVAQVEPAPIDSPTQQTVIEQVAASTTLSEPAKRPEADARPARKVTGAVAMERAAAAGKYLLVIFYRNDDSETQAMKKVVADFVAKPANKANSTTINVTDAAEKDIVAKFGVDRAPMPLALVVAPSGAITGGFPSKVTEEQLSGSFVSPGLAKSLKPLQDGKLVLLCVQNASTKSNDAALRGVNDFTADARFAKSTEVVNIDPTDDRESKFLSQVQIDPKTSEAVTALIAPPGVVVATYRGQTSKDAMIAALAAKQAAGGGG